MQAYDVHESEKGGNILLRNIVTCCVMHYIIDEKIATWDSLVVAFTLQEYKFTCSAYWEGSSEMRSVLFGNWLLHRPKIVAILEQYWFRKLWPTPHFEGKLNIYFFSFNILYLLQYYYQNIVTTHTHMEVSTEARVCFFSQFLGMNLCCLISQPLFLNWQLLWLEKQIETRPLCSCYDSYVNE
jgi:hypothetical protein